MCYLLGECFGTAPDTLHVATRIGNVWPNNPLLPDTEIALYGDQTVGAVIDFGQRSDEATEDDQHF